MPLDWTPLFQTSNSAGIGVQINTATVRGRSIYSARIGRVREDGSIGSFVPVGFRGDDGISRTRPDDLAATLAPLIADALTAMQDHADADDKRRCDEIAERDAKRLASATVNRQSRVGTGLAQYTSPDTLERRATAPKRDNSGRRAMLDADCRNRQGKAGGGSGKKKG